MDISKLLVCAMAACGIIKTLSFVCYIFGGFYIRMTALITYKKIGVLISSTQ